MTHWTTQQDSRDWILCFVGDLGQENSTPCFVLRNTNFTKTKWVPFKKLSPQRDLNKWEHPISLHHCRMVIKDCHQESIKSLICCMSSKPFLLSYVWSDMIGWITSSYVVILFLLYSKGNFIPSSMKTKTTSVLFSFLLYIRVGLIAIMNIGYVSLSF